MRSAERGSAMVVMLIVLVGLGTIAGLTVISVQSGSATTNNQRFNAIAIYAAESGAAAAIDAIRKNTGAGAPTFVPSAWLAASNVNPPTPNTIEGNDRPVGHPQNILSDDQRSWYKVVILNNRTDPGYLIPEDQDGIVTIHSTGYGPNGAIAEVEWEVKTDGVIGNPLTLLGWRQSL